MNERLKDLLVYLGLAIFGAGAFLLEDYKGKRDLRKTVQEEVEQQLNSRTTEES